MSTPAPLGRAGAGRMPLIECVPNISEGRDAALIEAACAALRAVPGLLLLDRTHDADHHRAVLTFAGPPAVIFAGAMALAELAIDRIDLDRHRGVHPRVGALDVLPLVPLEGVSVARTVRLAHRIGAALAARYALPVYYYGHAARAEARRPLAFVRNRGREALAAALASGDAALAPDEGPPALHPTAGATMVGVRAPLVAYNVVVRGGPRTAGRIARAIRGSSGGIPGLQAKGFALDSRGLGQVSMNLVEPPQGGAPPQIDAAYAAVAGALREGEAIVDSELIGLLPASQACGALARALQAEGLEQQPLIEARLRREQSAPSLSPLPLLERLSSRAPAPAGAAVCGIGGALGLAQLAMLARKRKLPELAAACDERWLELLALIEADAAAVPAMLAERAPGEARRAGCGPLLGQLEALLAPLELAAGGPLRGRLDRWLLGDLAVALGAVEAAGRGLVQLLTINLADVEAAWGAELAGRAEQLQRRLDAALATLRPS